MGGNYRRDKERRRQESECVTEGLLVLKLLGEVCVCARGFAGGGGDRVPLISKQDHTPVQYRRMITCTNLGPLQLNGKRP